jgi:poly(A) polymerase
VADVAKLPTQAWMTAPETSAVIKALTAEGAEVRFVGGCVRDAALGRAVADVDIATRDRPEVVSALLEAARLKVVPTGLKHGTVTAVVKGHHFEITTLRRDVETFGRHARVEFTDDWAADAARRDFTMNAMFLSVDGTLYDPFGGLADLEAGHVRFVGDARQRIEEDVLRLLRFFRFHARYGRGAPDADGLAACRALAHLVPTLSAERVRDETLKLLKAPAPADVLRLMAREDILGRYLAEARNFDRLAALVQLVPEHAAPDALRRLAAVLDADGAGARGARPSADIRAADRRARAASYALHARRRALSRSAAALLGRSPQARVGR